MKITDDVRKVLERQISITVFGGEGGPDATRSRLAIECKLDRVLYMKVAKVLEALDAKWFRNVQMFVSNGDLSGRIEQALVKGEVTTDSDLGFFPTPRRVAEEMAAFVVGQLNPASHILEPSAGDGALVDAVLALGVSPQNVVVVEWDLKRRLALSQRGCNVQNTVDQFDDFMDLINRVKFGFSGIIANPPFCKVGKGDHIDHLNAMIDLLEPGGRLACVMPASLIFRTDKRYAEARKRIGLFKGAKIEPLPEHSFKESGTLVNTCLVKIG